jgi:hypothetical protein
MGLLASLTGGRLFGSRFLAVREAHASARPPVFLTARTLEVAIAAATFVQREPNDDGERIVVYCNALGGPYVYSRAETERRVLLNFPDLVLEEVAAATKFLENRICLHMKPIYDDTKHNRSWVFGWRDNH